MATDFGRVLASVAIGEHEEFAGVLETDPRLKKRILNTYLPQLKVADPADPLGWNQSSNVSSWAWSATFTSWCVLNAGAIVSEFDFSIRHAMFIKSAIANEDAGRGVFRAKPIDSYAPDIGDLICNNRGGGRITYDQARERESYNSHSAIVVDFVRRSNKVYAVTIGGNESDSIRRTEVELRNGFVKQRSSDPYICVIQTLKETAEDNRLSPLFAEFGAGTGLQAARSALARSFRGHGSFVYDAVATIGDYGSADNVARAFVRAEMQHAWIRVHGRQPLSSSQKEATSELASSLVNHGISVAGWAWCQGEDARTEARSSLRELRRYGLSDFVADVEPEHNNSDWSIAEIEKFCGSVREELAGSFAISSFALIDWHKPHLMRAAASFVDAFAPQIYWFNFPNQSMLQQFTPPAGGSYQRDSPGSYADLCLDRWTRLSVNNPKPLIMTGQAYWGEGLFSQADATQKLRAFLEGWDGYDRLAGLNWWHFGGDRSMSHAMLEAIVDARLGGKVRN